ncbi:MAG TPA: hypothetical protein VI300_15515 [Solirubrobacter sp.]
MLHAIYRSTGKVNSKARPAGFSKRESLESFLAAWEAAGPVTGDLLFLNDGPVPEAQLELMQASGRVVVRAVADAMGAYVAALDLALEQAWPDGDLIYFGEDDYLYRSDTFAALAAAAEALPQADHFAPYATIGHTMPNGEPLHEGLRRPRLRGEALATVDGVTWHRATSHTVSYAIRVGALRADRPLHLLALRAGGAWDHAFCLACQGRQPFTARELLDPLPGGGPAARRAKVMLWRLAMSAVALRRRVSGAHVIAAPRPALASHMEVGLTAAGTDWAAAPGTLGYSSA